METSTDRCCYSVLFSVRKQSMHKMAYQLCMDTYGTLCTQIIPTHLVQLSKSNSYEMHACTFRSYSSICVFSVNYFVDSVLFYCKVSHCKS